MEIPDYITLAALVLGVFCVCLVGFILSISAHAIFKRFRKPKSKSRNAIQIEHISRIYEAAKEGVYREDMKAALDGLQDLRNIACEQIILNSENR